MTGTLIVAIWGAITGTVGTAVALRSRRDVSWGRREKAIAEIRPILGQVRDVLAEARVRPERIAAMSSPRVRTELESIVEATPRCADRRLRRLLTKAHTACSIVMASEDRITYAQSARLEDAIAAVSAALSRIDVIERRAPK